MNNFKLKFWPILLLALLMSSCNFQKNKVSNNIAKQTLSSVSVSSVEIVNNQLVITGRNFDNVKKIKVEGPYLNENFTIESMTSSRIVANAMKAVEIGVNGVFGKQGVFNLILSNADAAATVAVSFTLQDRSVTANKLSSMGAQIGQVLKFNGTTWIPSNLSSSQLYLGTYDAAANVPDLASTAPNAGDYYIVTAEGTYNSITYPVNSWIMYNGTDWEKISNGESIVSSFKGRRGVVVPLKGDYSLGQMSNVDLVTAPPLANHILQYNGANWVPGIISPFAQTALPTCGAGQVLKSDGTIFSCVTDNSGTGAFLGTPDRVVSTDGSGILTSSATTATELGYVAGVTSFIQIQLNNKQALDSTLTSLAAYNTNGIMVQTAGDTFVGRSLIGTANRMTVTNGDGVAENPTINIDTTLFPSPTGEDSGKFLKATAADTSAWSTFSSSDITTALGFTPINKAGDTISTGTFNFNGAAVLRTLDPIGVTDVATKQYVDSFGQWTVGGSDIYRSTGNVGIGTTAPGTSLTINKPAATNVWLGLSQADVMKGYVGLSGATNNGILGSSAGDLLIRGESQKILLGTQAAGAATMVLDTSGNVGIGTPTPATKLHILGTNATDTLRIVNGTEGLNKVLTSDASGNASWVTPTPAPVSSVFGRAGAVASANGDYTATQITNTAAGNIAALTVQAALNELDTEKLAATATFAGDVSGAYNATSVDKIKGQAISTTATTTQFLISDGTTYTPYAMSGDITMTNAGVTAIGTGKVTSTHIFDGTIANADINASAAIARTKLANGGVNSVVVNNVSGVMADLTGSTNGTILQHTVAGPAFTTATYPSATMVNQLLFSSSDNTVTGLTTANSSILTTNASGVPSWSVLSGDLFSQYALLAGRSGGQTLNGGTAASNNLTLDSTTDATKGYVLLAPSGGNVGIGTPTPATTAILDVSSTTKGVLIPRMTTAQRDAIVAPATGLEVFNTTTNKPNFYNGTGWQEVAVSTAGLTSLNGLTGQTQTFATPGSAGTAPAWTSAGSAHTLNIPMANTASVAAGLISKADYDVFNGKQGALVNSAGLAAALSDETGTGSVVFSASPTFTGTPYAPTAAANTNTTQIATTAFVVGQAGTAAPLMNGTAAVGTSLLYSRQDHVHATDTSRAPAAGSTSITTLGTITAGTWNGTAIAVANGGTGSTTKNFVDLTTAQSVEGAKTFADATVLLAGATSGATTLKANAVAGAYVITLPAATGTLALTSNITGTNSGTNTGDQTITLTGPVTGSGTGSFATTIATGVVTNAMLAGSIDLTTKVTGTLPIANGGTGASMAVTPGGIPYFTAGSVMASSTALANHGIVLGGATAPSTLAAAGTANSFLVTTVGNLDPSWRTPAQALSDMGAISAASPTFTGNVTMPGTGIWNSSGRVGIGTTLPNNQLEIYSSVYSSPMKFCFPNPPDLDRWFIDEASCLASPIGQSTNICTRVIDISGWFFPEYYFAGMAPPEIPGCSLDGATITANQLSFSAGNGSVTSKRFLQAEGHASLSGSYPTSQFRVTNNNSWVSMMIGVDWNDKGFIQSGSATTETGTHVLALQPVFGNVGIGLTGPNYKLDVAGDINTSTCFRIGATTVSGVCTSDARLKDNIQDYTQGLKELLGIRLRTYQFNGLGEMPKTGETAVGVIAQEVEKTNPSLVKTRKVKMHPEDQEQSEIKVVDYTKFTYMLINAVKDLYGQVKAIVARVINLEGKDEAKERAIASIKAENVAKDKEIKELKIKAKKAEQENTAIRSYLCSKDPRAAICK